jgi:hypothetical protein
MSPRSIGTLLLLSALMVIGAGDAAWRNRGAVRAADRPDLLQPHPHVEADQQPSAIDAAAAVAIVGAVIAGLQAWIFWRQFRIMAEQTRIAERQIELFQRQHAINFRPRLKIRHVTVDDPLGRASDQPGLSFDGGNPVHGALVVVNEGGIAAEILDSPYFTRFGKSETLPMTLMRDAAGNRPLAPDGQLFAADRQLDIGESRTIPFIGTARMPQARLGVIKVRQFQQEGWKLFVFGTIRYRPAMSDNVAGQERYMGFCRVWDGTGGFRPVDNPDYEFHD